MKKYALLVALAIAPSLAHDNLEIESMSHLLSKAKLAMQTETHHHAHAPAVINQDPFDEKDASEEKIAHRENLEALIAEAEKTIAKLDASKENHSSEKYDVASQDKEQTKFAFNKWAGLNQNPGSNYISGGSTGGAGSGASGGSSGGSSGGGKTPSDGKTTNNGNNPETPDGGVVATAVPEPEVYFMFLAGLGLIAYRAKKHFSR